MSSASFICARTYVFLCLHFCDCIMNLLFVLRAKEARPRLKRQYHARLEKVKEYLETVKDFNKLISPLISISLFPWSITFQQSLKEHRDCQEE